ncbi:MAG: hypothetical protein LBS95_00045 [Mycoplasmataceae bacterium]|jgi:hypothetical protein|nr:hypothetical protein [Mycoplasmataceae bacterium]
MVKTNELVINQRINWSSVTIKALENDIMNIVEKGAIEELLFSPPGLNKPTHPDKMISEEVINWEVMLKNKEIMIRQIERYEAEMLRREEFYFLQIEHEEIPDDTSEYLQDWILYQSATVDVLSEEELIQLFGKDHKDLDNDIKDRLLRIRRVFLS